MNDYDVVSIRCEVRMLFDKDSPYMVDLEVR